MSFFDSIAATLPDPFRILWRESVGSTNDEIRIFAENGAPEGLVLIADMQTAGRGRRGSVWLSPPGENLAFSILLRPNLPLAQWSRYSLIAGLCVAEALEKFVPCAQLKWPNDVKVGEKKIAGILIESGKGYLVVGIGINVNSTDFPDELRATSLYLETGRMISRAEVLHAVVSQLASYNCRIGKDFDQLLDSIRKRCALREKRIRFLINTSTHEGRVIAIGGEGQLIVEVDGEIREIFQADEIRVFE